MEPNRPLNVSVDSKSSRVVNISWIAGFDGNSAIQNYTVKRSLDNADFVDAVCQGSLSDSSCVVSSASASVGDLSPWTLYYFKVFARNMVGTSDGSPVVNATTNEEGALHVYKQCSFFNIYTHLICNICCCFHPTLLRHRLLDILIKVNQFDCLPV